MENTIVTCPHCGAKNRLPLDKTDTPAKCGRCHKSLITQHDNKKSNKTITLRCGQCRVKNRVELSRLHEGAKCGRCGAVIQHEDLFIGHSIVVDEANFNHTVMQSPLPVLLYGWAPWCGVCGGTTPMVEDFAADTKGKVRVGKLNVDANPNIASRYNIMGVPAFFIIDAGEIKEHIPGAVPKHELMMKMAAFIS
jgi:thioredoxin 2